MKIYRQIILALSLTTIINFSYCQTKWKSDRYGYTIEIPLNFSTSSAVGKNVDFKANKGSSSIVIVVNTLSSAYTNNTIWDLIGDLSTFGDDWENGAKEYMSNPQYIKGGKTTINGMESFWYDYKTDNPSLYSKVYQIKNKLLLYTFTLSCPTAEQSDYSAVWLRFKDSILL